jgi:hypothetical protein
MSKSYLTLSVLSSNKLEWTPEDAAERKEMIGGEARLKRIIRPDDKDTAADKQKKKDEQEERKKSGTPETITPGDIELRNVDAAIGVKGFIPLDLGDTGRIALGTRGGDAVTGLTLKSTTPNSMQWGLTQIGVTVEQLNLGGVQVKGDKPGGAEIQINGVTDGSIEFTGGKIMNPKKLEGTITNATVKNLAVDLGE